MCHYQQLIECFYICIKQWFTISVETLFLFNFLWLTQEETFSLRVKPIMMACTISSTDQLKWFAGAVEFTN